MYNCHINPKIINVLHEINSVWNLKDKYGEYMNS